MGNVIEKITLYDILGYLVPGTVLTGGVICIWISGNGLKVLEIWKDYSGPVLFVCLLSSYITGILLSELSHILLRYSEKRCISRVMNKETLGVGYKEMEEALRQSGVKDVNITAYQEGLAYLRYMYGKIQTDASYQRIHNYGSAEVFSKNLCMAIGIDIVMLIYTNRCSCMVFFIMVLCGGLCYSRWYRFCRKKAIYSVLWFLEKYTV